MEIESLTKLTEQNEQELKKLLLPKDPRDEKSVIMEIRAGTGAMKQDCSRPIYIVCIPAMRNGKMES